MKTLSLFLVVPLLAIRAVFAQGAPDIVWTTNAHSEGVRSVAFCPDSSLLASGGNDAYVRLWNVTNTANIQTFIAGQAHVLAVAVASDNELVGGGG